MLVRWRQPRRRRGNALVVLLLTGGVGWIIYRAIGTARQALPEAAAAAEGGQRFGRPGAAGAGGEARAGEQRGPGAAATEPTLTWRGVPDAAAGAAGLTTAPSAGQPGSTAGGGMGAAASGPGGAARGGAAARGGPEGGVTVGAGAPGEADAGGALSDLGLRSRDDSALPTADRSAASGAPDIREDTALGISMRDTGDRERDLTPPTAAPGTAGPRAETGGAGMDASDARAGSAGPQQAIASAMDQIGSALDERRGAGGSGTAGAVPGERLPGAADEGSPATAREGGASAPAASTARPAAGGGAVTNPKPAAGRGVLYQTPEASPLSASGLGSARVVGGGPTSTGIPGATSAMGLGGASGGAAGDESGGQSGGRSGGVPIRYAETPVEDLEITPPTRPSDPNVIIPRIDEFPAGGREVPIAYEESAPVPVEVETGDDSSASGGAAGGAPARGGASIAARQQGGAGAAGRSQGGVEAGSELMASPPDALTTPPERELAELPATERGGPAMGIAADRGGGATPASGGGAGGMSAASAPSGTPPASSGSASGPSAAAPGRAGGAGATPSGAAAAAAERAGQQAGARAGGPGESATRSGAQTGGTARSGAQAGAATASAAAGAASGRGGGATTTPEGQTPPRGGICPDDYPIKGNASSKIFHEPGSGSYNQTIPEVCFRNAAAAEAAGYRRPLSAARADRAAGLGETAGAIATGLDRKQEPASGQARREARGADHGRASADGTGAAPRRERSVVVPQGAVAGDGTHDCPGDHPIKGNASSRLFHKPGQQAYDRTIPEVCFASAEDAENAGYRAAKQ